jgi:hypothetical protein
MQFVRNTVLACLLLAIVVPSCTARADSPAASKVDLGIHRSEPFLWWRKQWFPYYHWSGYRMRPYFGVSPLYPESIIRAMTATRFNRVEGFTLGLGIPRLSRFKIGSFYVFGQLGYAFSLDKPRYRIALEYPVGASSSNNRILIGGSLYSNTATNDLWKVSDLENSLAGFFFKEDHLDYFDIHGWTAWVTGDFGPYTQLTAAYRDDRYLTLDKNTNWSVFGGSDFRGNPSIDEGRMHSVVFRLEAGRVGGLYSLPQGWSAQVEAELGSAVGGDFSFNRYQADIRWYESPDHWYGFSARLRGGFATNDAPVQKTFTIGGLGTVRAWPQNSIRGTRSVSGTLEAAIDGVNFLISGLQLFVFGDLGWAGFSDSSFLSSDQTLGALGGGLGFDQRRVRVELAVPVGPQSGGNPWVWLRLFPTF